MKNQILEIFKRPIFPILASSLITEIILCQLNATLGLISGVIIMACMIRCVKIGYRDGTEAAKRGEFIE